MRKSIYRRFDRALQPAKKQSYLKNQSFGRQRHSDVDHSLYILKARKKDGKIALASRFMLSVLRRKTTLLEFIQLKVMGLTLSAGFTKSCIASSG